MSIHAPQRTLHTVSATVRHLQRRGRPPVLPYLVMGTANTADITAHVTAHIATFGTQR